MSVDTHLRHTVFISAGPDHPFGTVVNVDGQPVPTARRVDVSLAVDEEPTVTIVHGCWAGVINGEYRAEHHCGLTAPVDDSPTGYLGTVKVVLREWASKTLLAGDVYGQQREEVLEEIEDHLEAVAIETARAVLDGAPKVDLRRLSEDEDAFIDTSVVHRLELADHLYIDGQAVRNLDIDPGVHALIRLPGAGA